MAESPLLIVRAEASPAIGTGHVMRMLALAQAWQDAGGRAVFLFAHANEPMRRRLEQEHCQVLELGLPSASLAEAGAVADYARTERAAWLAVDGYDFTAPYFETLNTAGVPLLLVADYVQTGRFPVAALLNQNPHARVEDFAGRVAGARLFLGLHYALLRREFRAWSACRPQRTGKISRILITMGGADPENVTERVVRELIGKIPREIQVKVVIGGNNPHGAAIRAATAPAGAQFECLDHVTEMPELLSKCDLAICAAGATCWEMAFMGVPALAIILAENQAPLAAALDHLGCGISLGWHHQLAGADLIQMIKNLLGEPDRTALMAARGHALVDGLGASRVVDCLGMVKIQPQLF